MASLRVQGSVASYHATRVLPDIVQVFGSRMSPDIVVIRPDPGDAERDRHPWPTAWHIRLELFQHSACSWLFIIVVGAG